MVISSPRANSKATDPVPIDWFEGGEAEHRRKMAEAINNILRGKIIQPIGSVTLTASQTTTTLSNPLIGASSWIGFMPTTANAAAATANLYVSARSDGSATLTHANNAQVDRTFVYIIFG